MRHHSCAPSTARNNRRSTCAKSCRRRSHIRRRCTGSSSRRPVASSTSTFEDWVESSSLQTRMLYKVPNVATSQRLVKLNLGTPTFNRGPGESSGTFGLESAIDELAYKLDVDPIDLRLRNYADMD